MQPIRGSHFTRASGFAWSRWWNAGGGVGIRRRPGRTIESSLRGHRPAWIWRPLGWTGLDCSKKEIWRKDVRQIKALGFNTVRTWIDWATGEPKQGEYRFENLDVILELAREEGLKVFLQVYMDSAPRWVGVRYPDSLFVSSNGAVVIPEASPGYCLDHPGVRQADLAFYAALAEHVRGNATFAGWDLWSEPHVINWATPSYIPNPEFCFCKNTRSTRR